ncbi:golgin subfamily A member 6-like protein 22 [Macrobrachium rosenbergii]|uniref:golgin subfamily A member 6-like protein 22 n=1 Tax=Macrobrachium rosenbergii TaxID=79674 RepID=UPI0034D5F6A0
MEELVSFYLLITGSKSGLERTVSVTPRAIASDRPAATKVGFVALENLRQEKDAFGGGEGLEKQFEERHQRTEGPDDNGALGNNYEEDIHRIKFFSIKKPKPINERKQMKEKIADALRRVKEMERMLEEAENEKKELIHHYEGVIEGRDRQIQHLLGKEAEARDESEKLGHQLSEAIKHGEDLEKELHKLQKKNNQLWRDHREEMKDRDEDVLQLRLSKSKLEEDNRRLEKRLADAVHHGQDVEKKLAEAEDEKRKLEHRLATAVEAASNWEQKLSEAGEEIRQFKMNGNESLEKPQELAKDAKDADVMEDVVLMQKNNGLWMDRHGKSMKNRNEGILQLRLLKGKLEEDNRSLEKQLADTLHHGQEIAEKLADGLQHRREIEKMLADAESC